jgi:predicted acylesterase/phospholipase RssA
VILPGQAELLRESARIEPPFTVHAPLLAVSTEITRLARRIAGLRVGLALGSGAAKGIAHVGLVAALTRIGVPIDVVTGTSIGALVGSGVAMGMDGHQIEATMDLLVDLWGEALKPVLPRFSLVSSKGLDHIVDELAGDIQFDELPLPFGSVATDLTSGRPVFMFHGSVARAVRASISIPLVFPPVFVGDYTLVDGFVTNPVPTAPMWFWRVISRVRSRSRTSLRSSTRSRRLTRRFPDAVRRTSSKPTCAARRS